MAPAALVVGGESIKGNPARKGLKALAVVDPTGLSGSTDAIISGVEDGKSATQIAGDVALEVMPGPNPKKGKVVVGAGQELIEQGAKHADDAGRLGKNAGKGVTECADKIKCFTRDTLVSTAKGLRPIGEVEPGDSVYAFDFTIGKWVLREVRERHDNIYEGPLLTIDLGDTRIETTVYHPFWVVQGRDLQERATPRELMPHEDQGQKLAGRWVNSHELRAGDLVFGRDGEQRRVLKVEQRFEDSLPVSNLTIRDHHTFAVGSSPILVHNTSKCQVKADGSVDIVIDGSKHPEAARHAQDAIDDGVSATGTIDRSGAKPRRQDRLGDQATVPNKDRDEFPPAVLDNGSGGHSVRPIDPSDNRGAGSSIGHQIDGIPNGTPATIVPINVPPKS